MPRRIIDPPIAQHETRAAFFARIWEQPDYRRIVEDLRDNPWKSLVAKFPALRDLDLDTLYQIQGGPSADRLQYDWYDAVGEGDRAKGAELYRALAPDDDNDVAPGFFAPSSVQLNAYLRSLERVVTTQVRLQEVADARAPNWALLELHAHVSEGEPPEYVELRRHRMHTTGFRVHCDISVDLHGAHIVCRDTEPSFDAWYDETFGGVPIPPFVDRHLTPPEAGTGFGDWKQFREELERATSAIADAAKTKLEASYKDHGMRRHKYPAQRKSPATQDDEPEETERADEVPENIERDDIGALVNWYFSQKKPPDHLDRDRLRDIARDQLAVRFPPPGLPEIPGEFLPRKRTQIPRTKGEKRNILGSGADAGGGHG